jgi:hypothetical protein
MRWIFCCRVLEISSSAAKEDQIQVSGSKFKGLAFVLDN